MDAAVLLATVLFCLSGGGLGQQADEPIATTPAVQDTFVEVDLAAPPAVVEGQTSTVLPSVEESVDEPVIDRSTETLEPIGTEVEPLDQIEPMFVDEVEPVTDEVSAQVETAPVETAPVEAVAVETVPVESAPVESAPVETAPLETARVETVPVEAAPIESAPVESAPLETQPVDTTPLDSVAPTSQPLEQGAKAIDPAESAIAEAETATDADEQAVEKTANDETVTDRSDEAVESTELDQDSLDAVQPIDLEDLLNLPDPQPEEVEMPVDEQATSVDSPFVQTLPLVEPDFVPQFDGVTVPKEPLQPSAP